MVSLPERVLGTSVASSHRSRRSQQRRRWLPFVLALLPAFTFGLLAAIAYLYYPTAFTPINNTLSELGNPDRNPGGAAFYRVGCVLGGSTTAAFFLCLEPWRATGTRLQNRLLSLVEGLGLLAALAMILFAAFPYDLRVSHLVVLGILANSSLALLVLSLVAFWRRTQSQRTRLAINILAIGAILLMFAIPDHHWAEWIPALLSQVCIWVLGFQSTRIVSPQQ